MKDILGLLMLIFAIPILIIGLIVWQVKGVRR